MKNKFITTTFLFLAVTLFAQNNTKQINTVQQKQIQEKTIYQLFPTKNYWTFLKLDTRNGKIWQVHFTVKYGEAQGD